MATISYAEEYPCLKPLLKKKVRTTVVTQDSADDYSETDSERVDSCSVISDFSADLELSKMQRLDERSLRTTMLTTKTVCHKFCDRKRRNRGPNRPLPAGTLVVICDRKDFGSVQEVVKKTESGRYRTFQETVRDRDLAHGECWYKLSKPVKGWIRASALMDAPSLVYRIEVLKLDTKLTTKTSAYCWRYCNAGGNNPSRLLKAGTSVYVKKCREFRDNEPTWFFVTDYVSHSERRTLINTNTPFVEGWVHQDALFNNTHHVVKAVAPIVPRTVSNTSHSREESRKLVAQASRFPYVVNESVMCHIDGQSTMATVTGITPLRVRVKGEDVVRDVHLSSLSKAPTKRWVVTEKSVGIRINPKNSNSVMRLNRWSEVEIVDFEGHFAKIHEPMIGWVRYRNERSVSMVPREYRPKAEDLALLVSNVPLGCASWDVFLCLEKGLDMDEAHVRVPGDLHRVTVQLKLTPNGESQIALVKFPSESAAVWKMQCLEEHSSTTPYVLGGEQLVMQMRPCALLFAATKQKDVAARWGHF